MDSDAYTKICYSDDEDIQRFVAVLVKTRAVEQQALQRLFSLSLLNALEREEKCLIIADGEYEQIITDEWLEQNGLELTLAHIKVEGYSVNRGSEDERFEFEVEPGQHQDLKWLESNEAYEQYASNEDLSDAEIYYLDKEPYIDKVVPAYIVSSIADEGVLDAGAEASSTMESKG